MKRFHKLSFLLILTAGFLLPAVLFASTRAFSLAEFQKQWQNTDRNDVNPVLKYMCGITFVEGFVIDSDQQDIVMYGQVNTESMPLYTDDFVIALRNAWMEYAELRNNTYYYSNPGCSIDPDPRVLAQLQQHSQRINAAASVDAKDETVELWHEICQMPQTVRVFGIPFLSRFASVMVEADYLLKRIVDGSFVPDVPGLTGLLPAIKGQLASDVQAGRPLSLALASMNRFWFYPGDYRFLYDDNVVKIESCPVTLLTESQYLSSSQKQIVGSGGTDPQAEQFTRDFTSHYTEIAAVEPLFAEMEALFRLVAIAKLMEHFKVTVSMDLDYLLKEFQLAEAGVPETLDGISRIERFEHTREIENGTEMIKLWLPSCGGVGMDIDVKDEVLQKDLDKKLQILKKRIINAKPGKNALFWDVEE